MKRSKVSEEQIAYALRQAESGTPVGGDCRQLGVIAYDLGNLLRRLVLPVSIQSWSTTSLQQWVVRPGGRLIRQARKRAGNKSETSGAGLRRALVRSYSP